MKVVYVAGPYRAPTLHAIVRHIRAAEGAALALWQAGFAVICPHLNTANFDGALPDEVWLAGDQELLRRCDAVFLLQGWEKSEGAQAEVRIAKQEGVPVYEDLERLKKELT